MLGEEISLALNGIPDAMLKNAMGVYERKKKERHIWVRAIACAAVLAILLSVAGLFADTSPYFSVQVYANETDMVELCRVGHTFFVPAYDSAKAPPKTDDPSYRPQFDSSLGAHIVQTDFVMRIRLNDETKKYYRNFTVLVDGQEKPAALGYSIADNGEVVGRFLVMYIEKTVRLDIILCDDNGKKLQHYGMIVKPVEGGWLVTLDEMYSSIGIREMLPVWTTSTEG